MIWMITPAYDFLKAPPEQYALTEADMLRFEEERALGMALPTDELLNQPTAPVPVEAIGSAAVQDVIDRLYAVAHGQRANPDDNGPKRRLVGLAAPQIGEPYSIVLIDTGIGKDRKELGDLECFINPEVIAVSEEMEEGREGCFSAGTVWGLVNRPVALTIRAYNRNAEQKTYELEGFTARIAGHELDHLHGIRFPERITDDTKRHWVHTEELPDYPAHMHEWPRLCTRERWEAYKRGIVL